MSLPVAAGTVPPDPRAPKFPRRRCDNCGKLYPLTKPNRRFCGAECKKEFHQHGAAFGPLKERIAKLIRKEVGAQLTAALDAEAFAYLGFVHRSQLRGLFARIAKLEQASNEIRGRFPDQGAHANRSAN
jgi:hypothetical protein